MRKQPFTEETVKRKIFEVHGDNVRLKSGTYINAKSLATFIDKDFGEWECTAILVWRGSRHPKKRDLEKTIPAEEISVRLKKIHNGLVSLVESSYRKVTSPATFMDRDFGEFSKLVNSVLAGHGHPKRGLKNNIDKNRKSLADIKQILYEKHDDQIKLKEETYEHTHVKCVFVDKDLGEFSALPTNVLYHGQGHPSRRQENYEKTCLKKYGVKNAIQNLEIAIKSARGTTKRFIKRHWKTGEELVCTASYESKVVDSLNENRIDFKWQPKVFEMPNGKTYRPDMFLVDENKWVEIKGYFRLESKSKWNWFLTQFPNSELWDQKKLKEMGIL